MGSPGVMTDYSEQGAVPVEDAATDGPPTVDEVLERQRENHPERAASSMMGREPTPEERAAFATGDDPVKDETGDGLDVEGPNSA